MATKTKKESNGWLWAAGLLALALIVKTAGGVRGPG